MKARYKSFSQRLTQRILIVIITTITIVSIIVVWGITHLLETMTIGYHLSELQVVNESVERRIDGVEAVHKYVGKTEQSDDLTLLSIRYK